MIGWKELLILLVIVLVVFGAKRLRTLGGDLGSAVKSFKKGMQDEPPEALPHDSAAPPPAPTRQENTAPPRDS